MRLDARNNSSSGNGGSSSGGGNTSPLSIGETANCAASRAVEFACAVSPFQNLYCASLSQSRARYSRVCVCALLSHSQELH